MLVFTPANRASNPGWSCRVWGCQVTVHTRVHHGSSQKWRLCIMTQWTRTKREQWMCGDWVQSWIHDLSPSSIYSSVFSPSLSPSFLFLNPSHCSGPGLLYAAINRRPLYTEGPSLLSSFPFLHFPRPFPFPSVSIQQQSLILCHLFYINGNTSSHCLYVFYRIGTMSHISFYV